MVGPKTRTSVAFVAILGLLIMTVACGGSSQTSGTHTSSEMAPPGTAASKDLAVAASGGDASVPAVGTGSNSSTSATTTNWDRKIIRNADIALKVTSVESMLATVRSITDGVGGVVFASSTSFSGDDQIATMTLDVPADQFDQVVNSLRAVPGVKKVEHESITSQDVTDDYIDLQSQLRNLQATETRLLALMDKATQLQDVLLLDQELSKIEGQIEQTTGRINYLDKRSSFSRITLTLSPFVVSAKNDVNSGFDLAKAVHDAWVASLRFTGGILTGLVTAGVFLWWFWPLAVAALGVWFARRQRGRGTKGNSEIVA